MDRRAFLRLLSSAPFAGAMPALGAEPAAASNAVASRRLLILIELKGGNDGLNTVVPYADPRYAALRPKLAISRDQVVQLTESAGLHPALAKLEPWWREERLGIVQGLGYPQPNLSHFRSIEIWDTASASDVYRDEGWLARAFAQSPSPPTFAADAVAIGTTDMGPLAGGSARTLALTSPEQFVRNARLARDEGETRNPALRHIVKVEQDILRSARRLDPGHVFKTEFPAGPFGNAVKAAAQLAANPAGIAALRLSLPGFDTHANQPGVQANLLRQLADGLVALRAALEEIDRWNDTLVATYSEFGRRARENQSNGTDHGTSSVHFVAGGRVKGGLYGAPPALGQLDGNGNLPFSVDFRAYYATILERWWGVDSSGVLAGRYSPLAVLA